MTTEHRSRGGGSPRSKASPKNETRDGDDLRLWRRATQDVQPIRRDKSPTVTAAAVLPPSQAPFAPSDKTDGPSTPAKPPPTPSPQPTRKRMPELAPDAAPDLDKRTFAKLRRGQLRPDSRIDLHGYTQEEAHRALIGFLAASQSVGRRCVLIITGHGTRSGGGVLRAAVPQWLNQPGLRERVLAFSTAQPADGGHGALYVLLRRHR